ncbi:hypothetical protein [Pyrobaculum aerophilum]|mgnify:CR=1 FL=1|uniref:hypothetical protein n=1 Tax=Pyrobaculum aerophilum TaxID=13773 RepID=UPI0023F0F674|nr:hypothetical protein [Pyrobaculum aerophilum]MCX8137214.1 hypothetical protein [Pyrobaculum aerophilum]
MLIWILVIISGIISVIIGVISLTVVAKLRRTRIGRGLFLTATFLIFSALTHIFAAVYWALNRYGLEVAMPLLTATLFLAISIISFYKVLSL